MADVKKSALRPDIDSPSAASPKGEVRDLRPKS